MTYAAVICDADDPCSVDTAYDPESSFASVIGRGKRILSKSNTRNRCGGTTNSGGVGACANTTPALRPEWDRRCARFDADWPDSMVLFLKVRSEAEDAQYCQPCCHSPGFFDRFVGGCCAILTSLVVRRTPPDPTGMWPEPIRRDTPLE